jgi:phosphoribosylaminoimidazole carboxylase (NCAIR synthetase)
MKNSIEMPEFDFVEEHTEATSSGKKYKLRYVSKASAIGYAGVQGVGVGYTLLGARHAALRRLRRAWANRAAALESQQPYPYAR